jgi:hypothetical protein
MTVAELIEALKEHPENARVIVDGYEGDYDTVTAVIGLTAVDGNADKWWLGRVTPTPSRFDASGCQLSRSRSTAAGPISLKTRTSRLPETRSQVATQDTRDDRQKMAPHVRPLSIFAMQAMSSALETGLRKKLIAPPSFLSSSSACTSPT